MPSRRRDRGGPFFRTLARAVAEDDLAGEAAKVAYYAFTSLFPLILVVLSLTGILGGQRAFDWIMGRIQHAVPPDTAALLGSYVAEVTNRPQPGLLSIGALLMLWSASAVVTALGDSLNATFEAEETRGFVKRRALALVLALFVGVALVASAVALIVGPEIASALHVGVVWTLVRWPLALALLAFALFVVYAILPNVRARGAFGSLVVGALVGAVAWVVATALFRLYAAHFGSYAKTYGAVGAVIVLLLWLYLSSMAILFGAELASILAERRRVSRARRTLAEATGRSALWRRSFA